MVWGWLVVWFAILGLLELASCVAAQLHESATTQVSRRSNPHVVHGARGIGRVQPGERQRQGRVHVRRGSDHHASIATERDALGRDGRSAGIGTAGRPCRPSSARSSAPRRQRRRTQRRLASETRAGARQQRRRGGNVSRRTVTESRHSQWEAEQLVTGKQERGRRQQRVVLAWSGRARPSLPHRASLPSMRTGQGALHPRKRGVQPPLIQRRCNNSLRVRRPRRSKRWPI